jgi:uncharacterized protein involved in response to NO
MKTISLAVAPPAAAGPQASQPWRPVRLLTAPHRLGFFAAAVLLATTGLWWCLVLVARYAAWPLPWAVPAPVAHGLVMALSFMPLFIVGFLFTAGPKWLALPDVPASSLLRPVLALSLGWGAALLGFHLSAALSALGIAAAAWAWAGLMARFWRLVRASPARDRLHAGAVAIAGLVGALAMAAAALAVALGQVPLARAAAQLALWGFLAPTFAIVSHRMLPFFTAGVLPWLEAWRPNGLLAAMLAALGVTAVGAMLDALGPVALSPALHLMLLAVQLPAAGLVLWLALRWGLLHSLRTRLLAMLHLGFVWLGVSLGLAALSHGRVLWMGEQASLGLAPLHALTMGFLGGTLIAMTTRVAAGHSGRALAADNLAWGLYLLLQTGAVLRVVAALWPAMGVVLTVAAALAWAAACTGWALRYGNWLGRPRVDGRPG